MTKYLGRLECGSPTCRKLVPLALVYCCDDCAAGLGHARACKGAEALRNDDEHAAPQPAPTAPHPGSYSYA